MPAWRVKPSAGYTPVPALRGMHACPDLSGLIMSVGVNKILWIFNDRSKICLSLKKFLKHFPGS